MDSNIWTAVSAEDENTDKSSDQPTGEAACPTDGEPAGQSENDTTDQPADSPEKDSEKPKKPKLPGQSLLDWAQALAMAIGVIVITFTFLLRIIGVDGESMLPSLIDNDRIVISNIGYTPQRGDIVVIHVDGYTEPLIKRVIALPGEQIRLEPEEGAVYVNDIKLDEPYTAEPTWKNYDTPIHTNVTVPDGCIFVMGDNRNHSSDSRSEHVGMIDERQIIGRALFRLFPLDTFGGL